MEYTAGEWCLSTFLGDIIQIIIGVRLKLNFYKDTLKFRTH